MTEQTEIISEQNELEIKNTNIVIPQEYAGIGGDDLDDVTVPLGYTKLIQKMSPEVDSGIANVGDFFDTSTQQVLGTETNIIVVKKVTDWACFDDDTNIKYSSDGIVWNNGEGLTDEEMWKKRRLRLYVVNPNAMDIVPTILVIKGTSRAAGQFITSSLKRFAKVNREPIFARNFKLTSIKESNDKYTYQVMKATLNEGFNDKSVMDMAYEARKMADAHISIYSAEDDIADRQEQELKEDLGLDT